MRFFYESIKRAIEPVLDEYMDTPTPTSLADAVLRHIVMAKRHPERAHMALIAIERDCRAELEGRNTWDGRTPREQLHAAWLAEQAKEPH